MTAILVVEQSVIIVARTAAIEAVEADIEACGVINAVEALRAVFTVDAL